MRKIAEISGKNGICKVYRDAEWNEWVVKPTWNEKASYHTWDKADALQTASVIVNG